MSFTAIPDAFTAPIRAVPLEESGLERSTLEKFGNGQSTPAAEVDR